MSSARDALLDARFDITPREDTEEHPKHLQCASELTRKIIFYKAPNFRNRGMGWMGWIASLK